MPKGPKRPKGRISGRGSGRGRSFSKRERGASPKAKPQYHHGVHETTGERNRIKFTPNNSIAATLALQDEVRRRALIIETTGTDPRTGQPVEKKGGGTDE